MGVILLTATGALAAEHHVSTSGELNAAITSAADGDVIILASGNYHLVDGNLISTGMTLRGASGDPADVFINLEYLTQGMIAQDSFQGEEPIRLESLTFKYFDVDTALLEHSGSLILDNCIFEVNIALKMVEGHGDLEVSQCQFITNVAYRVLECHGSTVVSASLIYGSNSDTVILVATDDFEMTGSTIEANSGIQVDVMTEQAAHITDCLFVDNFNGMAVLRGNIYSSISVVQSTFDENSHIKGALILEPLAEATFDHCDIGICGYYDGFTQPVSTLNLICCELDLERWDILGYLEIDDDDCSVGTSEQTLGGLKALFNN